MNSKLFLVGILMFTAGCASMLRTEYMKTYDGKFREQIENGHVAIGMRPDEAKAAWGPTMNINRTAVGDSYTEQWVYGSCTRYYCKHSYLYFTDGVLTGWQN